MGIILEEKFIEYLGLHKSLYNTEPNYDITDDNNENVGFHYIHNDMTYLYINRGKISCLKPEIKKYFNKSEFEFSTNDGFKANMEMSDDNILIYTTDTSIHIQKECSEVYFSFIDKEKNYKETLLYHSNNPESFEYKKIDLNKKKHNFIDEYISKKLRNPNIESTIEEELKEGTPSRELINKCAKSLDPILKEFPDFLINISRNVKSKTLTNIFRSYRDKEVLDNENKNANTLKKTPKNSKKVKN